MLEERGMAQADLMEVVTRFKGEAEVGAVLFSVVGGRISEGIDFPDKELQLAVIIGVPYPKPTAKQRALMHYYETQVPQGMGDNRQGADQPQDAAGHRPADPDRDGRRGGGHPGQAGQAVHRPDRPAAHR